jgi:Na+-transporting methylmalonyl-CoA/oxaloacetate decarboxylase gamma subunit
MSSGFPSLTGAQEEMEEGFWSSFSNVMMVILKIFLLVIVMMALNNRNLLDDLKHSVKAKEAAQVEAQKSAQDAQKAAQVAEFQLKENATLEEQLDYLQQRSTALEMELLSSRAETEQARSLNTDKETELTRLQALAREQADSLSLREQSLNALQTELSSKNAEISGLYTKVDESEKKLLSMNGSYAELDKKYQKLLKPARSSKGKQVVEVVYQKGGYGIRKPGEAGQRSVGRDVLESELAGLKAQYGTDLYVKVIIPDNSGLSYNEAWRFTNDMLSKYDYYHQPDSSVPAPR